MTAAAARFTDVHTWIGPYPWRHVPHPDAEALVRVLEREGVAAAWVGHLPSAFYRDPSPGNVALATALAVYRGRLTAVPTVRPDWPSWREALRRAADEGAPAIRLYPQCWGLGPGDARLAEFSSAAHERRVALLFTVRFEDPRQRHPLDGVPDLQAATIRELARAGTSAMLVVAGAGRAFIEEVHWGLTPAERERVVWDISGIWGPPEDDLAHLFTVMGAERFVYGSGWPLRLAQTPRANLALLPEALRDVRLAEIVRA